MEIVGIALTTDTKATFETNSLINLAGYEMSKRAADEVYNKTKVCPRQIGVVELHDCFSANELITYEALGLCPEGKAGEFIDSGANTYGGRVVVNVTMFVKRIAFWRSDFQGASSWCYGFSPMLGTVLAVERNGIEAIGAEP